MKICSYRNTPYEYELFIDSYHISGKVVQAYYGDSREPEHIEVRDLADEVRIQDEAPQPQVDRGD
jgi:hypothetical protein